VDDAALCSVEECSHGLRDVVVNGRMYKRRLGRIFRRKKVNNYMLLTQELEGAQSALENSQYYKKKLFNYTHRQVIVVGGGSEANNSH